MLGQPRVGGKSLCGTGQVGPRRRLPPQRQQALPQLLLDVRILSAGGTPLIDQPLLDRQLLLDPS